MSNSYIGTRYVRPDAVGKVTGTVPYTSDLFETRKDMLVAKVKRIPCSHAKIIRINAEAAKALPGVVAVLTADDIPGAGRYGYRVHDKPLIAKDEVICDCDPVALVAAETEEAAEAAIDLIEVEYEALPMIEDPRASAQPDAPLIHKNHPQTKGSNVVNDVLVARGDVDAAFQNAAVIIENDYRTPIVEHACIETDVAIAEPNRVNGGMTFYCPVQDVHQMRRGLCVALNLPVSKIRVVSLVIGGGFGGKECSSVDCGAVAGILAMKTGRPVMYNMTREEVFRYTSKRHRSFITYRLGADKDGKILGMRADGMFDKGAYTAVDVIPHRAATNAGGPYYIPAADVHNLSSFTNHVYGGAFRGLGSPQQHFALECTMDDLALKLGVDPIDLRLANLLAEGDTTIFGQRVSKSNGMGMRECLCKLRERMNWDTPFDNSDPYIKRGRGVACLMYGTGSSNVRDGGHTYAEMNQDGSLNVNISQNELGQGLISAMTLIAAETMGVTLDKVSVGISDSFAAPDAGSTTASRTTVFQGNSIFDACSILKERFLKVASELLNEPLNGLDIKENMVFARDYPEKNLPLKTVIAKAAVSQVPLATLGHWYPPMVYPDPTNRNQTTRFAALAFGAQGVEVEVDIRTGIITIVRSVQALDLGRAINPLTAEGQMDGGSAQALGWGLMEEEFLKNGRITGTSFHEFLIPTAMDLPRLENIIVEAGNDYGPYGAKGIGEPTILGGAPALRNAVLNATGLAMYEIPLTPVRIMAALEDMKNAKENERFPYFKVPLEEHRNR